MEDNSHIFAQIRKTVEKLNDPSVSEYGYIPLHQKPSPSVSAVCEIIQLMRRIFFPGFFGPSKEGLVDLVNHYAFGHLFSVHNLLVEQIRRSLCLESPGKGNCCEEASRIALEFIDGIPNVRRLLATDVDAIVRCDPAATGATEVIFCYPAVTAIFHYRVAHVLYELGVPLIPRMITEKAHTETGIDIHPGARIGEYFSIDHGTGVVIGQTAVIGNHVRLYQGVTLGAKSFAVDESGLPVNIPRHPIIEDNVTIYSNTSVLGRITIGRGSIIGGNIWLTRDVPPDSRILQPRAIEGEDATA
ncbi:MAG: serine acetyltransferase [Tannerellaceae bacterium]|jgi:serine O-acetyltransferase|nr:serine acetyltransferase [Tannerellaceae bacterium]